MRGIELNRKKRKEAEEQERIKAEKAANTVHSKEEAISAVKAFYNREMTRTDPEGYLDRYTSFIAEDHGKTYTVYATYGGNMDVDYSIYQIDKENKNNIIKER